VRGLRRGRDARRHRHRQDRRRPRCVARAHRGHPRRHPGGGAPGTSAPATAEPLRRPRPGRGPPRPDPR
jgi:hypothetical protein